MSQKCVTAVYRTYAEAREAVNILEREGFSDRHVSLVARDVEQEVPHTQKQDLKAGDEGISQAARGAGLGTLVGALAGSPLLMISGLGAAVVAGPIAAAATGAIVGGFLGGMSGWGVHEDHVRQYEQKVKSGRTLVIVSGDTQSVTEAERILAATPTEELNVHARSSEDAPEIDDRQA